MQSAAVWPLSGDQSVAVQCCPSAYYGHRGHRSLILNGISPIQNLTFIFPPIIIDIVSRAHLTITQPRIITVSYEADREGGSEGEKKREEVGGATEGGQSGQRPVRERELRGKGPVTSRGM